jgi:hypothetical protein
MCTLIGGFVHNSRFEKKNKAVQSVSFTASNALSIRGSGVAEDSLLGDVRA